MFTKNYILIEKQDCHAFAAITLTKSFIDTSYIAANNSIFREKRKFVYCICGHITVRLITDSPPNSHIPAEKFRTCLSLRFAIVHLSFVFDSTGACSLATSAVKSDQMAAATMEEEEAVDFLDHHLKEEEEEEEEDERGIHEEEGELGMEKVRQGERVEMRSAAQRATQKIPRHLLLGVAVEADRRGNSPVVGEDIPVEVAGKRRIRVRSVRCCRGMKGRCCWTKSPRCFLLLLLLSRVEIPASFACDAYNNSRR